MKRRVSILVPSLSRGGMTRAYVIAGALRHAGADAEIIGALDSGAALYPEPSPDVAVRAVAAAPFVRRIAAIRRAADGDLLYAIKPRVTSFGVALLIGGARPVVVDIDDFEAGFTADSPPASAAQRAWNVMRRARNLDHPSYTRLLESRLSRADAITANTRLLAERFGAVYLPSGKDTTLFDPARHDPEASRRALGLDRYRVIMFPGTPRPHKGVEDVLLALERLDWPDARLVLVGGREAGDEFADALAARFTHRVIRLPRFGTADMPRVVAAAHVVVATQRDTPTARAQFPMKLTDAMAMAKPIVSTRVGDIPEALDGAAWLVPPSSPEAIAAALAEIFANPDLAARRGLAARRRCEERFSHAALGRVMAGVLESLGSGQRNAKSRL